MLNLKWRTFQKILTSLSPSLKTTFKFGCLFTGSEWSQQLIIYKVWNDEAKTFHTVDTRKKLDWGSIGRYAIWGFCIFPHILRRWYALIDRKIVGSGWKVALSKTAIG